MKEEGNASTPVSADGSEGVQVGTGNVQNNTWTTRAPLEPASLRDLSPHTILRRLRDMPHDDVVDLFAKATPSDVAGVLKALVEADKSWVVTVVVAALGDINPRKATGLIAPLATSVAWLEALPKASEEIERKARELKWSYRGRSGHLKRYGVGYVRGYKRGRVYWHRDYGAHGVSEEMGIRQVGIPKFPVSDEESAPASPYGTAGSHQWFTTGIFYLSSRGTCRVGLDFHKVYESEGGSARWLGFPIRETSEGSIPSYLPGRERFEGGVIYLAPNSREGGFAVRAEVEKSLYVVLRHYFPRPQGSELSGLTLFPERTWVKPALYVPSGEIFVRGFYPVSKEAPIEESTFGTRATVQHFAIYGSKGYEYFGFPRHLIQRNWVVYSSAENPSVVISPEIWEYYRSLGAETSWLGLPVEQISSFRTRGIQEFEGGMIYLKYGADPIAVPKALKEVTSGEVHGLLKPLSYPGELMERLGYPETEEQPILEGEADRMQFFENGVAALKNGKRQIWFT